MRCYEWWKMQGGVMRCDGGGGEEGAGMDNRHQMRRLLGFCEWGAERC